MSTEEVVRSESQRPEGTAVRATSAGELRLVRIADLNRSIHARAAKDAEHVEHFVVLLGEGHELPPPDVISDPNTGNMYLAGGYHRVAAHERLGHEFVLCRVQEGTRTSAILLAVSQDLNLSRSNADKRRAVEMLLAEPEWQQWTDAEIGRRCGVDPKTVASVRNRLGIGNAAVRKTVNGRTINTSKIGRRTASQEVPESLPKRSSTSSAAEPNCSVEPVPSTEVQDAAAKCVASEPATPTQASRKVPASEVDDGWLTPEPTQEQYRYPDRLPAGWIWLLDGTSMIGVARVVDAIEEERPILEPPRSLPRLTIHDLDFSENHTSDPDESASSYLTESAPGTDGFRQLHLPPRTDLSDVLPIEDCLPLVLALTEGNAEKLSDLRRFGYQPLGNGETPTPFSDLILVYGDGTHVTHLAHAKAGATRRPVRVVSLVCTSDDLDDAVLVTHSAGKYHSLWARTT